MKEARGRQSSAARRRVAINAQLLSHNHGYRRAGVSRYIENLVTHLARGDTENEYTVFLNHLHEFPDSFVRVRSRLPTQNPWIRILWEQCLLPLQVQTRRIELLHSPVNVQPLRLPCRGVVTVTDLSFMMFPESFRAFQGTYQRLFTRLSARRATRLIAISKSTAEDVTRLFGVPAERIDVVYPGIDDAFSPAQEDLNASGFRQKNALPQRYILYVGTLEPRKNLLTLLEAYATYRRTARQAQSLVLAGAKGWLYQPIFQAVERLGLVSDVLFPGFIPDADLPCWYRAADVFVYPSVYEGFGLPPLEAMACGTPAIVSSASSLPEVVGDAAVRVDPHRPEEWVAALDLLCSNRHLRDEFSTRGIARARSFTWTRTAERTRQVYRDSFEGGT